MTDLSFPAFVETDVAKAIINEEEVLARLLKVAHEITTLTSLVKLMRERFPDRFHVDPRKAFAMRPVLNRLWAAYLEFREANNTVMKKTA